MDVSEKMRSLHMELRDLKAEIQNLKAKHRQALAKVKSDGENLKSAIFYVKECHHTAKESRFDAEGDVYLLKKDLMDIESASELALDHLERTVDDFCNSL
jgi:predicted RNase H-like nuclease (RuvC/YqgF family)